MRTHKTARLAFVVMLLSVVGIPLPSKGDSGTREGGMSPQELAEVAKTLPPGTRIRFLQKHENAANTGAGIEAVGEKVDASFNAQAANATAGSATSSGGGVVGAARATDLPKATALFILGGLCLVGAATLAYFRMFAPALGLGATGVALLLIAFYPAILLWGLLLVVLGLGGFLAYEAWGRKSANTQALSSFEAVRALIAGLETHPNRPAAKSILENAINNHADPSDIAIIQKVRNLDGPFEPLT